jgi:hypothetical protein
MFFILNNRIVGTATKFKRKNYIDLKDTKKNNPTSSIQREILVSFKEKKNIVQK